MARENNIDLNGVKGTGAGGRITKQDVEAYIAQQKGAPAAAQPPAAGVLLGLTAYWAAYVLLFGVIASFVFRRREF